jgi:hypothetical protein
MMREYAASIGQRLHPVERYTNDGMDGRLADRVISPAAATRLPIWPDWPWIRGYKAYGINLRAKL